IDKQIIRVSGRPHLKLNLRNKRNSARRIYYTIQKLKRYLRKSTIQVLNDSRRIYQISRCHSSRNSVSCLSISASVIGVFTLLRNEDKLDGVLTTLIN